MLEKKLREMKKKLAQIASIPNIIQSTLDTVSKTFENFLLSEFADVDDGDNDNNIVDKKIILSKNKNYDDDTTSLLSDADESVSYLDDLSNHSDVDYYNLNEDRQFTELDHVRDSSIEVIIDEDEEVVMTPEPAEPPAEPTEEELMKLEKQIKV